MKTTFYLGLLKKICRFSYLAHRPAYYLSSVSSEEHANETISTVIAVSDPY